MNRPKNPIYVLSSLLDDILALPSVRLVPVPML